MPPHTSLVNKMLPFTYCFIHSSRFLFGGRILFLTMAEGARQERYRSTTLAEGFNKLSRQYHQWNQVFTRLIKLRNTSYVETAWDSKHRSHLVGNSTRSDTGAYVRHKIRKPCNTMRWGEQWANQSISNRWRRPRATKPPQSTAFLFVIFLWYNALSMTNFTFYNAEHPLLVPRPLSVTIPNSFCNFYIGNRCTGSAFVK